MTDQITVLVQTQESTLQLAKVPKPKAGPGQLLVKVTHAAQNPTDGIIYALDQNRFGPGAVLECDFVGTVEEMGDQVDRDDLTMGDTIAGLVRGGAVKNLGAFAEYSIAQKDACFKLPPGMDPAEAATIPLAAATAWLAMFSSRCLRMKRAGGNQYLLVWGGSSSVGLHTLQLAKLHSIPTITTCSPRNFDLVSSYGADHFFDYSDPEVITKIKAIAPDLQFVFDTIGNPTSSTTAAECIGGKGRLCTVRPGKMYTEGVRKEIEISDVMVWTGLGVEVRYGEAFWPVSQEDQDLTAELFRKIPEWYWEGRFRGNRTKVLKGLESVEKGFQIFRDGEISGFKVVYAI